MRTQSEIRTRSDFGWSEQSYLNTYRADSFLRPFRVEQVLVPGAVVYRFQTHGRFKRGAASMRRRSEGSETSYNGLSEDFLGGTGPSIGFPFPGIPGIPGIPGGPYPPGPRRIPALRAMPQRYPQGGHNRGGVK